MSESVVVHLAKAEVELVDLRREVASLRAGNALLASTLQLLTSIPTPEVNESCQRILELPAGASALAWHEEEKRRAVREALEEVSRAIESERAKIREKNEGKVFPKTLTAVFALDIIGDRIGALAAAKEE